MVGIVAVELDVLLEVGLVREVELLYGPNVKEEDSGPLAPVENKPP
jgi:hypothetical protein